MFIDCPYNPWSLSGYIRKYGFNFFADRFEICGISEIKPFPPISTQNCNPFHLSFFGESSAYRILQCIQIFFQQIIGHTLETIASVPSRDCWANEDTLVESARRRIWKASSAKKWFTREQIHPRSPRIRNSPLTHCTAPCENQEGWAIVSHFTVFSRRSEKLSKGAIESDFPHTSLVHRLAVKGRRVSPYWVSWNCVISRSCDCSENTFWRRDSPLFRALSPLHPCSHPMHSTWISFEWSIVHLFHLFSLLFLQPILSRSWIIWSPGVVDLMISMIYSWNFIRSSSCSHIYLTYSALL